MFRNAWLLSVVILIAPILTNVEKAGAEGYALLVGINDYLVISPDLKFCESDVSLFKQTLVNEAGFKEANIKTLLSKEATKRNIMTSITHWLTDNVKQGDKVVFYFSGHGIQLEDDGNDESDGKDELLCAYDSTLYDITFIRDDELDRWFRKINTTDKIVILDCCHSGTATKDVSIWNTIKEYHPAEGEVQLIRPEEWDKVKDEIRLEDYLDEESLMSTKAVMMPGKQFENTVLISACDAHQVAIESSKAKHGLLTYYLTSGLNGPADTDRDGVITIEEAAGFAKRSIKSEGWDQDPQLEGDFTGKSFVGAPAVAAPDPTTTTPPTATTSTPPQTVATTTAGPDSYVTYGVITSIHGEGSDVKVSLGANDNVIKGSIYSVFPASVSNLSGQGIGRIKITSVSDNESSASLFDGKANRGDKVALYAKPLKSSRLLVHVEEPEIIGGTNVVASLPRRLRLSIESALKTKPFIEVVASDVVPDKIIRTGIGKANAARLIRLSMRVINVNLNNSWQPYEIESSPARITDAGANLVQAALDAELKSAYVVKNLIDLKNDGSRFKINLSVDKDYYEIGDVVNISVQPTNDCYITLIDITTSGKAYVLYPNEYEKGAIVRKGSKLTIPSVGIYQIQVGGPSGLEMVKAIATTEPLDLSSLNPDDPNSPIKFFSSDNLFQISELPAKDLTLKPVSLWATEATTFRIGEASIYSGDRDPLLLPLLE
jgi:hypothetical protein